MSFGILFLRRFSETPPPGYMSEEGDAQEQNGSDSMDTNILSPLSSPSPPIGEWHFEFFQPLNVIRFRWINDLMDVIASE